MRSRQRPTDVLSHMSYDELLLAEGPSSHILTGRPALCPNGEQMVSKVLMYVKNFTRPLIR